MGGFGHRDDKVTREGNGRGIRRKIMKVRRSLLLLLTGVLASCSSPLAPPDDPPDYRGEWTGRFRTSAPAPTSEYSMIDARGDTLILLVGDAEGLRERADGGFTRIEWDAIPRGASVEIWKQGPILLSDPPYVGVRTLVARYEPSGL